MREYKAAISGNGAFAEWREKTMSKTVLNAGMQLIKPLGVIISNVVLVKHTSAGFAWSRLELVSGYANT